MRLFHRFLCWFPLWALGTCGAIVGLAIAAAQVWPAAKLWDERQRDWIFALVSQPIFRFVAGIVIAAWLFLTWLTWPARREGAAAPVTYMSPHQVIHYMADEAEWGWCKRRERKPGKAGGDPVMFKAMALLEAPSEFRREAQREGTPVRVWGTKSFSAKSELIPHTFWMANGLCPDQIFYPERLSQTQPAIALAGIGNEIYERLKIDGRGVHKAWPRMNFIKRLIIRHQIWKEEAAWRSQVTSANDSIDC